MHFLILTVVAIQIGVIPGFGLAFDSHLGFCGRDWAVRSSRASIHASKKRREKICVRVPMVGEWLQRKGGAERPVSPGQQRSPEAGPGGVWLPAHHCVIFVGPEVAGVQRNQRVTSE